MKSIKISAVCLSLLLMAGCVDEPGFPAKPNIDFLSLSRSVVDQGDTLRIFLHVEDGDGDLGFQEVDTSNCSLCDLTDPNSCINHPTWSLFLIDERDECLQLFRLPFIEPEGQFDDIDGEIEILLANICCKDPNNPIFCPTTIPTDTVFFRVMLKDRAGNFSDTLQLPGIKINCI